MNRGMYYECLHISETWFEIGNKKEDEKSEDVAFKFIAYWISFNALYSQFSDQEMTEAIQIEKYIYEMSKYQLNGIFKKIWEIDAADIFKEYPVFGGNRNPKEGVNYLTSSDKGYSVDLYRKLNNKNLNDEDRLIALLLTIKQVRNNMFHGGKTPYPNRNYELVDGSQKILEIILKKLLLNI